MRARWWQKSDAPCWSLQLKIAIDLEWRCSVSDWRQLPEAVLTGMRSLEGGSGR